MVATTLMGRMWRWRDRLLADPAMQNLAVALPFLRPVANRRARQLFDLCIGFVHTQVVTACVEFSIFEHLAERPLTIEELSTRTGLSADATERLMRAANSLKLVSRMKDDGQGERYRLGELGAALRGAPGVVEIVRHNQIFYRDLADPVALLRKQKTDTELSGYWPYAEGQENVADLTSENIRPYTQFMAATQPFIADDVLAAFNFRRHRALLDVGGGNGTFAAAVARQNPDLKVGVFDLPAVVEEARPVASEPGLSERMTIHEGDFHRDPLPQGYDVISLVRICLDHDDETVLRLLRSVRTALPPGGQLLVAELMAGAAGAETISDSYFGFYLMAMGRGRPRRISELRAMIEQAGFEAVRLVPTRRMLMTQLLTATAPASDDVGSAAG